MAAYDQDTWSLNVARLASDRKRHEHYCEIRLPPTHTKEEAQQKADQIASMFWCDSHADWKFTLTRWELRGQEVSF